MAEFVEVAWKNKGRLDKILTIEVYYPLFLYFKNKIDDRSDMLVAAIQKKVKIKIETHEIGRSYHSNYKFTNQFQYETIAFLRKNFYILANELFVLKEINNIYAYLALNFPSFQNLGAKRHYLSSLKKLIDDPVYILEIQKCLKQLIIVEAAILDLPEIKKRIELGDRVGAKALYLVNFDRIDLKGNSSSVISEIRRKVS